MAILQPGSDMTLAPTAAAVVQAAGGSLREAADALARAGFASVQLDATLAGLRPRDLTHRARQDLLAMLGRAGLRVAGLDLFLPRRHYLEAARIDRALAATTAAIDLAADLGRVPLSLALPGQGLAEDARRAVVEAAEGRSVPLVLHAEDELDALRPWLDAVDLGLVGAGVDPAAAIGLGAAPDAVVHRLGRRLTGARLDDTAGRASGGLRCPVGTGELDVLRYRIALDLTHTRAGPVVLDLRGLADPVRAATAGREAWERAGMP